MKIAGSVCRVLAATVAVLAAVAASGQNLLNNAEFDADGSGWTEANGSVQAVYRGDLGSTLAGGSGPGALEIRFSQWNGASSGVYQLVAVSPGTVYVTGVSVFVPTSENPAWGAPLIIDWYSSSDAFISTEVLWPPQFVKGEWMRTDGEVVAPAGAATAWIFPTVANPDDANETRAGVAVLDDLLFAVEGTGTTVQEMFYPAGASVAGLLGTFWTTDGWFYNAAASSVDLFGAFLPQGSDNSSAVGSATRLATIRSGGSIVLSDLVASLGGTGQTGGIYLRAEAQGAGRPLPSLHATSFTSTPNPNGGGSYGQGIPAVGRGVRVVAVAPGVFQNAQRRTNVGVLNTSGVTISVEVRVLDGTGASAATATWTLAPYEQRQTGLPALGVTSLSAGAVVFELTSGSGSYRGYSSSVDAITGDAVYTEGR